MRTIEQDNIWQLSSAQVSDELLVYGTLWVSTDKGKHNRQLPKDSVEGIINLITENQAAEMKTDSSVNIVRIASVVRSTH